MPWCPKCKAEFREGFSVCNTCHVPLIDHIPDGTETIAEPAQPDEDWLREDGKRTKLLRLLRTLIILFLALAVVLLLADKGI